MAVYIAGNGISRRRICLKLVNSKGVLYGCNNIYKEVTPDVLVATDDEQAHLIQDLGYAHHREFYTRSPYADKGAKKLKAPYSNWSSGPNAVQLAVMHGHTHLYLFGFDFGSANDKFNNVYAGHELYKTKDDPPTYGGNWYNQIRTVMIHNPNVQFTVVTGPETAIMYSEPLNELENVEIISVDEFLIHINNV